MVRLLCIIAIATVCCLPLFAVESVPWKSSTLVGARAGILMDRATGVVLWQWNPDERVPMASTTKIMTAMVILDHGADRLDQRTTVSEVAFATGGSSLLAMGDQLTLRDLLQAALVKSSNEATVAAAEMLAGNEATFVGWMNDKARELGLRNTHFMNPHGLYADGHYSSARDLAIIARHALQQYPLIRETVCKGMPPFPINIVSGKSGQPELRMLESRNKILGQQVSGIPGAVVDGVKTGFVVESGKCLVSSATMGPMQLIAVVLNSPDIFEDSQRLLHYGFARYTWSTLATVGQPAARVPVRFGAVADVTVGPQQALAAPVAKPGLGKAVDTRVVFVPNGGQDDTSPLRAPIRQGDTLGTLHLMRGDQEIATTPALALRAVPIVWWVTAGKIVGGIMGVLVGLILLGSIYGTCAKVYRRRRRRLATTR